MKNTAEIKEHYFLLLENYWRFMLGDSDGYEKHLKEYNKRFDRLIKKELAVESERYYWKNKVQEIKTLAWVLDRDVWADCEELYDKSLKD